MSKLTLNDLNVQFNLNECFVKACDSRIIAIVSREGNLYEIPLTKLHRVDVANLVQSPMKDGVLKL